MKFDSEKCNSNQKWNNDKCRCECKSPKEHRVCEKKNYIWNPATCRCENGKYVGSIIDDSVIVCDEIIEETKTVLSKSTSTKTIPTNSTLTKNVPTKVMSTNIYMLLAFLLITIALLLAVIIYCFFIKHRAKQNHLLPCHYTTS